MMFSHRSDPFENLEILVKDATEKGLRDANAMALATVDAATRQPSVRIVLFKGLIRGGLSFYTNYEGRKGRELLADSLASVCFFWPTLETQIRVEGTVARLTREESDAYFRTRPRLSQLGAWASHQSDEIANHEDLERRIAEFEEKFKGVDVPCPSNWGGYRLIPTGFEFWFARQGRLHERYCYEKQGADWRRFMRSP